MSDESEERGYRLKAAKPGNPGSPVFFALGMTLLSLLLFESAALFFLFPLPFPVNARALVLIVVAFNVISSLREGPVSVPTHFGGMAAGYGYMKLMPRIRAWRRQQRARGAGDDRGAVDKLGEAVDNIFKFENKRRK